MLIYLFLGPITGHYLEFFTKHGKFPGVPVGTVKGAKFPRWE